MAKKPANSEDIRRKAQELAKQQADKEKRAKIIRYTLVAVVLLALVVLIITLVLVSGSQKTKGEKPNSDGTLSSVALPAAYAEGGAVYVDKNGVSNAKPTGNVPVIEEFFDYACIHCALLEKNQGAELFKGAKEGKYVLKLSMVNTESRIFIWGPVATEAALHVAAEDPQHFEAFHQALLDWYAEHYQTSDGNDIYNRKLVKDAQSAKQQVLAIAKEAGVKDGLLEGIGSVAGAKFQDLNSEVWDKEWSSKVKDGLGTPMLVTIPGGEVKVNESADIKTIEDYHRLFVATAQKQAMSAAGK